MIVLNNSISIAAILLQRCRFYSMSQNKISVFYSIPPNRFPTFKASTLKNRDTYANFCFGEIAFFLFTLQSGGAKNHTYRYGCLLCVG